MVYAETGVGPDSNLAGWDFGNTNVTADTFYGDFIGDITGSPSSFGTLTTDNLTEGTSNLYFTDARAQAAISQASGGGISYDSSNGQISVDNTVIRTTGAQTLGGVKTFTGGIKINTANSIHFENDKHLISYNDGRGNFNIRVGTDDDEVVTEAGYVFHTEWSQSSGFYAIYVSPGSQAVGDQQGGSEANDFNWREQFRVDKDKVYLKYQNSTKLNTTNDGISVAGNIAVTGTVDGADIAAMNTKLATIDQNADETPSWVPATDPNYLTSETSHADVLVDGDFTSSGLMRTDGTGGYSVDTNTYLTGITSNQVTDALGFTPGTSSLELGTTSTTALAGDTALFDGAFSSLTGTPTTIAGYGITDALQLGTTSTTALAGDTSIPSNTSDLTNDSNFITGISSGDVTTALGYTPYQEGTDLTVGSKMEYDTSNIVRINQRYTGASTGNYFEDGEYQKVVTITPDGSSQNYQVLGRMVVQSGAATQTINFNAALRSGTLPD